MKESDAYPWEVRVLLTEEALKRDAAVIDILDELVSTSLAYHCPYCGKRKPFETCRSCKYLESCIEGGVLGCPGCLNCEGISGKLRAVED